MASYHKTNTAAAQSFHIVSQLNTNAMLWITATTPYTTVNTPLRLLLLLLLLLERHLRMCLH